MNGLDQIVIALWFLPVVLFIIVPLCVGTFWLPVWLLYRLIQQESEPLKQLETTVS
jgi:hypothetical protein